MRLTSLFILVVLILGLTAAAWHITGSNLDFSPLGNHGDTKLRLKKINEILAATDIESLKELATELVLDTDRDIKKFERQQMVSLGQNLLLLAVLLSFTAMIVAFREIAARGRTYMKIQKTKS